MLKYITKGITIILIIGILPVTNAQVGGENAYEFLNVSQSARVSALGDYLINPVDDDVALAYGNPALLNELTHRQLSFNHVFHLGGISHGFFNYGRSDNKFYNETIVKMQSLLSDLKYI